MDKPDLRYIIAVVEQQPPWYWRMIGRRYWKGWRVVMIVNDGRDDEELKISSAPAKRPPNPHDVAQATMKVHIRVLTHMNDYLNRPIAQLPEPVPPPVPRDYLHGRQEENHQQEESYEQKALRRAAVRRAVDITLGLGHQQKDFRQEKIQPVNPPIFPSPLTGDAFNFPPHFPTKAPFSETPGGDRQREGERRRDESESRVTELQAARRSRREALGGGTDD